MVVPKNLYNIYGKDHVDNVIDLQIKPYSSQQLHEISLDQDHIANIESGVDGITIYAQVNGRGNNIMVEENGDDNSYETDEEDVNNDSESEEDVGDDYEIKSDEDEHYIVYFVRRSQNTYSQSKGQLRNTHLLGAPILENEQARMKP
ncbi:hypothetical protein FNV43_RR11007 [Rhamnella rubrinervis]|uniref:Uncharacterized protein n=1 Tax=Rhamnella rubrinervis TaxID=2594499 RepID=A0A8K0H5G1_9ROSA|nr:hypothetical protein FNV43_RR11007 [Rhamnella rubrinervis]